VGITSLDEGLTPTSGNVQQSGGRFFVSIEVEIVSPDPEGELLSTKSLLPLRATYLIDGYCHHLFGCIIEFFDQIQRIG